MEDKPSKVCSKCKETKPLRKFYYSCRRYRPDCMDCHKKVVGSKYVKKGVQDG